MSETPSNSVNAVRESSWLLDIMKDSDVWHRLESKHLLYAQAGREFVVWTSINDQPVIKDIYKVSGVDLTLTKGLSVFLTSLVAHSDETLVIGCCPKQLKVKVFLWVPAFADIRFTPTDYSQGGKSRRMLSVPFFAKVASNPNKYLIEGGSYFSTMQEFKQLWPNVPVEVA